MAGQAAAKTRQQVTAEMKRLDMSTSSNKMGRYSGGDPVGKKNQANQPICHNGSSKHCG